jgi:hypothetical protein
MPAATRGVSTSLMKKLLHTEGSKTHIISRLVAAVPDAMEIRCIFPLLHLAWFRREGGTYSYLYTVSKSGDRLAANAIILGATHHAYWWMIMGDVIIDFIYV